MESKDRRDEILEHLKQAGHPVKGSELAKMFAVSRQVIVQDIALIRAKGISVVATPSGYMIQTPITTGVLKTICCK
ncbi:HTH domain-containing protein, partial [Turicibacter sanguinis]|nr:HTH domain-containing protein [Turicibacter sanguinis]